jgi:hypothetical protein
MKTSGKINWAEWGETIDFVGAEATIKSKSKTHH